MEFAAKYQQSLTETLATLDHEAINKAIAWVKEARDNDQTIFVAGNGGSASTASHFACDIVKGASYQRAKRFKIMALTDNLATITAYSNDVGYDCVFVEQMKNFAKPVFFLAGCAATATLFSSLGLTSPEHQDPAPAHAGENTKPKVVKAVPKSPAADESKLHGSQIEAPETRPDAKPDAKGDAKTEEQASRASTKAVKAEAKAKTTATATETETEVSADDALTKLQEGNARWVSDQISARRGSENPRM